MTEQIYKGNWHAIWLKFLFFWCLDHAKTKKNMFSNRTGISQYTKKHAITSSVIYYSTEAQKFKIYYFYMLKHSFWSCYYNNM